MTTGRKIFIFVVFLALSVWSMRESRRADENRALADSYRDHWEELCGECHP